MADLAQLLLVESITFTQGAAIFCRLLVQHSDPKAASQTLSILDMKTGATRGLQKPYAALGSLSALETGDSMRIATVGASPDKPSAVIALDCSADGLADSTAEQWQVLKKSSAVEVRIKTKLHRSNGSAAMPCNSTCLEQRLKACSQP